MPVLDMTLARDTKKFCFLTSSVGRKLIMAITGFAFIGFITGHMIGNLTAYLSIVERATGKIPGTAMNEYAHFLKDVGHGYGIWGVRAGLLGLVLLHGWAALTTTLDSWAARPKGYRKYDRKSATWASRLMRCTAIFLALFVIYHLLHLTVGLPYLHCAENPIVVDATGGSVDVFRNFVNGFKDPLASGIYIVANLCLGLHIWHGIWSFSQTLGLSHPRYDKLRRYVATLWAMAIVGVNISFPIAVQLNILWY
ncbi:MAG: succinate dehydrogenase cytochrome b subunit [Holophagaceae bacterium]|nr:succinate dehydrogenase cytochrome b subunit [Holophagaceae bacterium]